MPATMETMVRTDAGLAAGLRVAVARLTRRLRSERDPDSELSIGQLSVLGALFRNGTCSIGELANHEGVQPPSMTRTVNCLEEAGYVVRKRHATDGRQVVIGLTAAAEELLNAEARAREAWLTGQLQQLSPEERTTLRDAAVIMDKLASG